MLNLRAFNIQKYNQMSNFFQEIGKSQKKVFTKNIDNFYIKTI